MRTNGLRLFGSAVLTGSLLITHTVIADDVVILAASEDRPSLVNMMGPEGFIIQLEAVDSGILVDQLYELRSLLISRKQELASELGEKKFDAGDAVLTLVMPGGLIYAGYKKFVYEHARHDLEEVSEDIAEYSRDLALLQEQMRPVTVARLR